MLGGRIKFNREKPAVGIMGTKPTEPMTLSIFLYLYPRTLVDLEFSEVGDFPKNGPRPESQPYLSA